MTVFVLVDGTQVPVVDPAALVSEARRVQQADLAEWGHLAFRRRVFRERLDRRGEPLDVMLLDFWVTPRGGGRFDEVLRGIDGRLPTRTEVREHRRARRFEKRYRTAFVGESEDYDKGDFSLAHFMTRPSYRYGGVETIDGMRCHRLDFPAQGEGGGRGVANRISRATEGTLWLETEGLHAIRAESRLVHPVSAMLGVLEIERVEITMTTQRFGNHRLPREIVVTTTSVLAGRRQHKRNRFFYSHHEAGEPPEGGRRR